MYFKFFKNLLVIRFLKGTAPSGRLHCGYFVPMIKLDHFLTDGWIIRKYHWKLLNIEQYFMRKSLIIVNIYWG